MVPSSALEIASYGGIAILRNTDTPNSAGVLLVREQRLAGMDIPHPEW